MTAKRAARRSCPDDASQHCQRDLLRLAILCEELSFVLRELATRPDDMVRTIRNWNDAVRRWERQRARRTAACGKSATED